MTVPRPEISSSLVQTLRRAQQITVLTGAGISAESGVPTFRDAQTGLWSRYKAEELATPEAFARDPKLVWDWYQWRRQLVSQVEPNPGHRALATLEQQVAGFTLVTQNVDGLHRRAGSQQVLELHGNLFGNKCFGCNAPGETGPEDNALPQCRRCGALLRPDVVWFGEMLPSDVLNAAQTATTQCQVFFSIGTSSLVYPAAELPYTALHNGATVVEINTQTTPLSSQAHHLIKGFAGEILPRLLAEAWGSESVTSYE
jgi:NAD-dependent deacetylase